MDTLNPFKTAHLIVIKVGSALLVDTDTGEVRSDWLTALAKDISNLRSEGNNVLIVSSGAIAMGRHKLGLSGRPSTLPHKQACAAIGQSLLTQAYAKAFNPFKMLTAQSLLTLEDTANRRRWLNARSTLQTLLDFGCVPIVNENDTVATDEIRFGDNDRLSARTAQMIGADTLILLSDIDGLYDHDPRLHANAAHIPVIDKLTPEIMSMGGVANGKSGVGTGGMTTKLQAAKISMDAGCDMCIADGRALSPIERLRRGELCTWFKASVDPARARRQWIAGQLRCRGTVWIDAGAETALGSGKSLLAAGVTRVEGDFKKGDAVDICVNGDSIIGRGLVSYNAHEMQIIKGLQSAQISDFLGFENGPAVIHRDNMVIGVL